MECLFLYASLRLASRRIGLIRRKRWERQIYYNHAYTTETKQGELRAKCIEELARKRGLDEIEALVIDNRLLTLIKIISTGLGEDMNLNIVPGDRWKYNTETNEIIFPVELLLTSTPEEIVGFSAHEAGHRQISRHNMRKAVFKRFFSKEYLRLLLNAFEDSRIDNWLISAIEPFGDRRNEASLLST